MKIILSITLLFFVSTKIFSQTEDTIEGRKLLSIASAYFQTHDTANAVKYYKLSAEKNYYGGIYALGSCSYNAIGMPKNDSLAKEYFMIVANKTYKNVPEELYYSQTYLAFLSATCQERYNWDFKASESNYTPAQIDIAYMYLAEGCLGKADTTKAIEWYSKAAKNKDFKSAYFIAKKYTQDYLDDGAKNNGLRKRAYLWQIISNEFKDDFMRNGGTLNFIDMLDTRRYQSRLQTELSKKEIATLKKDAELFIGQPLKKYESMVAGPMEIYPQNIPK